MSLRHIIVEGCDGSGKTTLVTRLSKSLGWPVHKRASSSLDGPVHEVDKWALQDINTMGQQPSSIYDRHPIISERIYAPIARRVPPVGLFQHQDFTESLLDGAAEWALMVVCYPPWSFVWRNMLDEHSVQMEGVRSNARSLYRAYRDVGRIWPGHIIWWNGYQSNEYDYRELLVNIGARIRGEFDAD